MIKKAIAMLIRVGKTVIKTIKTTWSKLTEDVKRNIMLVFFLTIGWDMVAVGFGWASVPFYTWLGLMLLIDAIATVIQTYWPHNHRGEG